MFLRRKKGDFYNNPDLLSLLRDRDRDVQEQIWREERRRLKAVAQSILHSSDEAEALVSDLFCDFFFHYVDEVRKSRAIPAYLRIMAVRRARRLLGRARRQVPVESVESEVAGEDTSRDACDRIDRTIWYRWLEECLAGLSDRARTVIKMYYGHEMSYATIAGNLGGSKQAVGKMTLKSLEALRRCIEERRAAATKE